MRPVTATLPSGITERYSVPATGGVSKADPKKYCRVNAGSMSAFQTSPSSARM